MKVFASIVLFFLCVNSLSAKLKEGVYRAVLILDESENIELPFNFEVLYKKRKPLIIIRNAEEKIVVDEITVKDDSVKFQMPVFNTEFLCVQKGNDLEGIWINHYRKEKNVLKFYAKHGNQNRFDFSPGKPNPVFEGKWEVTFSPETKDSSKAIGIFKHQEMTDYITGTFLTETGDYRFLEGMKNGDKLYLSSFDGSHAYLFVAVLREGAFIEGTYYSGAHWKENWIGIRNPGFKLRNPEEIATLKNPGQTITFSFPDLKGKPVSLSDKQFHNKPVILQIIGSWCSNCMDESIYFSELYEQYKKEGLEIIAVSFEKTTDPLKAKQQVEKMVKRLKINYTVLLSMQTGKTKASEAFTFVSEISAFPTSVFLNKEHKVVKIHTGFNGPATGEEYLRFKESTGALIRQLIKE